MDYQPFNYKPEEVSIPLLIILSIVTCGIYYLYWMYKTANDLKTVTGDPTINPGVDILLSLITCGIYSAYWHYKYAKIVYQLQINYGVPNPQDNAVLNVVLSIFSGGIIAGAILQTSLNELWRYV